MPTQIAFEIDQVEEAGIPALQPKIRKARRVNPASQEISSTLMSFGEEDCGEYGPWIVTTKNDADCLKLSDRHYSRVTVGAAQFTRPGRNFCLRTQLGDAVWVSWY